MKTEDLEMLTGPAGQIRVADLVKHKVRIQEVFPPLLEKFSEIDLNMTSTVSWAELEVFAGGTGEWLEYQLDQVIGLELLKQQIRQFHHSIVMDQKRRDTGHNVRTISKYHMIFQGNPGTGKTSLARIIAQLLHRIGIIKTDVLSKCSATSWLQSMSGKQGQRHKKSLNKQNKGCFSLMRHIGSARKVGKVTSEEKP